MAQSTVVGQEHPNIGSLLPGPTPWRDRHFLPNRPPASWCSRPQSLTFGGLTVARPVAGDQRSGSHSGHDNSSRHPPVPHTFSVISPASEVLDARQANVHTRSHSPKRLAPAG
jgi:hypothetical protein